MTTLTKDTLIFLQELAKNNRRTWFQKNKERYQQAKDNFDAVITDLFEALEGPFELDFTSPKECIHRIYRNLRFSKDKTPYKTFMSANISAHGKKGYVSGIYIHVDPTNGSFLGGGVYHPDSKTLQALREEVAENGDKLKKILASKTVKKMFGELQGEQLKTCPRGYDPEHQHLDLLRHKDFILSRPLNKSLLTTKAFSEEVIATAMAMKPFLDFLKGAMRRRPIDRS